MNGLAREGRRYQENSEVGIAYRQVDLVPPVLAEENRPVGPRVERALAETRTAWLHQPKEFVDQPLVVMGVADEAEKFGWGGHGPTLGSRHVECNHEYSE